MRPILPKRAVEFVTVLLSIALLIGIAIPVYLKVVQKAGSVAAESNLNTAQQEVDVTLTSAPLTGGTYGAIDATSLGRGFPKTRWKDVAPGSSLPPYEDLSSEQKNALYIAKPNPEEICVFVITLRQQLKFVFAKTGSWQLPVTVPYERGIPGIMSTGGAQ